MAFAHAQMKEHELGEDSCMEFIEGEVDVLVATTIIETGMDISNVNTIIIHDADNMGLSQLYQLRGRVGRSNRTAYAFLYIREIRCSRRSPRSVSMRFGNIPIWAADLRIAMPGYGDKGSRYFAGTEAAWPHARR